MKLVKYWASRILFATVCASILGAALVPMAYAERGYSAIGGEWLAIILCWIGVLWMVTGGTEK